MSTYIVALNMGARQSQIRIKRVYEPPSQEDGCRVLVDRLWPRGLTKEKAAVDEWAKALAPSTALRKWFGHQPALWGDFRKKYKVELEHNDSLAAFIREHQQRTVITLLYGTKDTEHTHARILKEYLEDHWKHA